MWLKKKHPMSQQEIKIKKSKSTTDISPLRVDNAPDTFDTQNFFVVLFVW